MSGFSFVRDGMEEREQLGFVTEDNGIVSAYRVKFALQPGSGITRLGIVETGGNIGNVLYFGYVVKKFPRECVA